MILIGYAAFGEVTMNSKRFFIQCLIAGGSVLCCFTISVAAQGPKPQVPAPKDLLRKVEEVYAICNSYSDTGVVVTQLISTDGKKSEEKPENATFTTTFVRPNSFRFEYRYRHKDKGKRYIIWAKGKEVRTWWDADRQREGKPESLISALKVATGVTYDASTAIPRLLLADPKATRRLANGEPDQLADSTVNDKECTRIRRKYQAVNFEDGSLFDVLDVYWVEKTTFLVRRIEREMTTPKHAFRTTITYTPKINEDIPAKAFEFNPPTDESEDTPEKAKEIVR